MVSDEGSSDSRDEEMTNSVLNEFISIAVKVEHENHRECSWKVFELRHFEEENEWSSRNRGETAVE